MLTKKDIRKQFLERRLNLDAGTAAALNSRLLENCRQLDYSGVHRVHTFLPITEKKEVNTWPIIRWLRQTYPHLQWVLPRALLSTGEMEHFLWEEHTPLVNSRYGIPEPAGGMRIAPEALDLVLVPMLAFDRAGHRVGYGKGMYDRFLQQCRPDVRTVGLSLFEPVNVIIDTDDHDVPLDTVVTPDTIFHFDKK
ncbi:5-formyltetrahydrofolate cyclo-ligase [Chitinophaga japonensis]|uniref:5-formyltetrahydrofolate cyclo-ligase n=1 Tax=Chitinophaga japonensis TaxID=104662 RepID=A0A562SM99_CHIJA|nr:5-formyltetrahydrofolate cyclo-ligase [Chitinophaga japonensis]TWI82445.1 5-formyltetrahydrofolate cyclo-ligase [Chitinophaga japonensis]